MIEFLLAYWSEFKGPLIFVAIMMGVVTAALLTAGIINAFIAKQRVRRDNSYHRDKDQQEVETAERLGPLFFLYARRFGVVLLPLVFIACLPSIEDMWKIRLALLKYNLASPENVTKGSEEISRIAKKLECKYLGGCEETIHASKNANGDFEVKLIEAPKKK